MRDMSDFSIEYQNRPAKSDKAVYFCVDAKFYPYALFIANQIATKYPQRDFDLCLISAERLPEHPLNQVHDLRILQVDASAWGSKLPSDDRISFAAYLRIMVPALLGSDYRRMLYLDADIFYQRGDLNRLLALDLGGRPLGAVRDTIQLRYPDKVPMDFIALGLPYAKYFNSGVLLIDSQAWNDLQITEKTLSFAAENAAKLLAHDQTVLNVLLRDNWAELSLVWNFAYNHQSLYFSSMFDICLYHFVGRRKPFTQRYGGFPRRFTEEYRQFFADHMPQLAGSAQNGLEIRKHRKEHFGALGFHLLNFARFLPNDDRFLSDWDVIL